MTKTTSAALIAALESATTFDPVDTGLRLCEVDPRKNPAFSPNLYRWLRKNKSQRRFCDRFEHEGMEYLGYQDDQGFLIGSRLWGVLCQGGAEKVWAYPRLGRLAVLRPLWDDYRVRGRCAIDPDHAQLFVDDRFEEGPGNSRRCLWCGHVQYREVVPVTTMKEHWV